MMKNEPVRMEDGEEIPCPKYILPAADGDVHTWVIEGGGTLLRSAHFVAGKCVPDIPQMDLGVLIGPLEQLLDGHHPKIWMAALECDLRGIEAREECQCTLSFGLESGKQGCGCLTFQLFNLGFVEAVDIKIL